MLNQRQQAGEYRQVGVYLQRPNAAAEPQRTNRKKSNHKFEAPIDLEEAKTHTTQLHGNVRTLASSPTQFKFLPFTMLSPSLYLCSSVSQCCIVACSFFPAFLISPRPTTVRFPWSWQFHTFTVSPLICSTMLAISRACPVQGWWATNSAGRPGIT